MSRIVQYFQILATIGGKLSGFGTRESPLGETTGDGTSSPGVRTFTVAAGATAILYDFTRDGQGFEVAVVRASNAGWLWVGGGSPPGGSAAPTNLTWNAVPIVPDFAVTLGSSIPTNPSAALHAADNAGAPQGATDAGEVEGMVHRIAFTNTGSEVVEVEFCHFN